MLKWIKEASMPVWVVGLSLAVVCLSWGGVTAYFLGLMAAQKAVMARQAKDLENCQTVKGAATGAVAAYETAVDVQNKGIAGFKADVAKLETKIDQTNRDVAVIRQHTTKAITRIQLAPRQTTDACADARALIDRVLGEERK